MSELCLRHLVVAVVAACLLNGCEQPQAQAKVVIQTQPVKATGELVAATSFKASPPSVSQLWQYNIKELAPESSLLKAGDVVVGFDSQTIAEQLETKTVELQSARQELTNRQQQDEQRFEELKLELAERKMEFERDQRKAEITDHSRSANDRRKARIDFTIASNQYDLAKSRLDFHQQQRQAQAEMLQSKIARLHSEVEQFSDEISRMRVTAPFAGMVIYVTDYQGEKSSVGDTVQFGQPIAEISQMDTLYVKAEIDEIDVKRLQLGQKVQIQIDALPERSFSGTLTSLGVAVRDKSVENLSRVVDAQVKFDALDTGLLRPGMSARLNIQPLAAAAQPATTQLQDSAP
ncbi:hemolysin [Rheinheimera sp. SA_1]|uniref:HlyD family secretion protein n=1 Tax=Rheinheimera sp. SA_1 TaxID=1827365 RepID=UPI00080015AC|nr:efflux RND transporter periplasmic adaptor subunit [Rheinheimera sp. SA_1]OBP14519.1 hemolysin [Rheinheimera sp. SA_1]